MEVLEARTYDVEPALELASEMRAEPVRLVGNRKRFKDVFRRAANTEHRDQEALRLRRHRPGRGSRRECSGT